MNEIKTIDKVFYKEMGKLIHKKRESAGISLNELAKLTGISKQCLDNYELGKTKIKQDTFNLICKSLGSNNKFEVVVKGK